MPIILFELRELELEWLDGDEEGDTEAEVEALDKPVLNEPVLLLDEPELVFVVEVSCVGLEPPDVGAVPGTIYRTLDINHS